MEWIHTRARSYSVLLSTGRNNGKWYCTTVEEGHQIGKGVFDFNDPTRYTRSFTAISV